MGDAFILPITWKWCLLVHWGISTKRRLIQSYSMSDFELTNKKFTVMLKELNSFNWIKLKWAQHCYTAPISLRGVIRKWNWCSEIIVQSYLTLPILGAHTAGFLIHWSWLLYKFGDTSDYVSAFSSEPAAGSSEAGSNRSSNSTSSLRREVLELAYYGAECDIGDG